MNDWYENSRRSSPTPSFRRRPESIFGHCRQPINLGGTNADFHPSVCRPQACMDDSSENNPRSISRLSDSRIAPIATFIPRDEGDNPHEIFQARLLSFLAQRGIYSPRPNNPLHIHFDAQEHMLYLEYITDIRPQSPSDHTYPTETNSTALGKIMLAHSQNVSCSQIVSSHTSREAAASPRITRATPIMDTAKNNVLAHSQTVSHSQYVSSHSPREAAALPRTTSTTHLMDTAKRIASAHSQTVSYSQYVSSHSPREAATLPRTTSQLVSPAPRSLCMTYKTACHSERSEESKMSYHLHSGRSATKPPRRIRFLASLLHSASFSMASAAHSQRSSLSIEMRQPILKPSHILNMSHRGKLQPRLAPRVPHVSWIQPKEMRRPFSNRLIFSICLIAGSCRLTSKRESHPSHGYSQKKCASPFSNRLIFSMCLIAGSCRLASKRESYPVHGQGLCRLSRNVYNCRRA